MKFSPGPLGGGGGGGGGGGAKFEISPQTGKVNLLESPPPLNYDILSHS